MMRKEAAKDVDSYLADLPNDVRATLEKLRKTIRAAAPQAEEVISYHMPAYKYHGMLVYFAAFTNHCSLFLATKSLQTTFKAELKFFEVKNGTIHFTPDHPLPLTLVRKIIKARIKQNEEKAKNKKEK